MTGASNPTANTLDMEHKVMPDEYKTRREREEAVGTAQIPPLEEDCEKQRR